jgi:hypothetical protein
MDEMYREKRRKYKATRTFWVNICLLTMLRDHVLNIKIKYPNNLRQQKRGFVYDVLFYCLMGNVCVCVCPREGMNE